MFLNMSSGIKKVVDQGSSFPTFQGVHSLLLPSVTIRTTSVLLSILSSKPGIASHMVGALEIFIV